MCIILRVFLPVVFYQTLSGLSLTMFESSSVMFLLKYSFEQNPSLWQTEWGSMYLIQIEFMIGSIIYVMAPLHTILSSMCFFSQYWRPILESRISKGLLGMDFLASLTMKWQALQTGDNDWVRNAHSRKSVTSKNTPFFLMI